MRVSDRLRRWWQLRTGQEETPLDGDVAAWLVSLVFHAGLLAVLTILTLLLPPEQRLLLSAMPVVIEDELEPEEFAFSEMPHEAVGALADQGEASARPEASVAADEPQIVVDVEPESLLGEIEALQFDDPVFEAPRVTDDVALKGEGSVGTTGAAGAIDRITNEIVLSLDQRPTLVVWLFDQSGSLERQRAEIVERFDRVYRELGVIEAAGNPAFARYKDKPLLTAVAQFGATVALLTPQPTDDVEEIKSSVRGVTNDTSGIENVFGAIGSMATQFRHHRLKAPRRNVMIVVFTDEAGDDWNQLDATVDRCRKYEMPVYVVGVPAPFGRRDAYVRYVDPDPRFSQQTQWVPVHQGPESLVSERLRLTFGGEGPDDEMIDSGFGPYGLTRLTYETGGVYFAVHPNRRVGRRVRRGETAIMSAYVSVFFDPLVMRSYRPDYLSVQEYRRLLGENRARAALVRAAELSWAQPMQNPRTRFPKVDDAEFARDLSIAQRDAAELEPTIDHIVRTLRQGEPDRTGLIKPRWQAGFDLAMGRALAVKVRTEGYNAMLAKAKQGLAFENEQSDTWILRPSDEISTGSVLAKETDQAKTYLERVVSEHEGTPWAMLAKRELQTPLGWQWQERFMNVAARREAQAAGNRRRNNNGPPRAPDKPLRKPPAL